MKESYLFEPLPTVKVDLLLLGCPQSGKKSLLRKLNYSPNSLARNAQFVNYDFIKKSYRVRELNADIQMRLFCATTQERSFTTKQFRSAYAAIYMFDIQENLEVVKERLGNALELFDKECNVNLII